MMQKNSRITGKSWFIIMFFMYLFILVLLILYLFPLFYVFNASLKTEREFMKNSVSITTAVNFVNYTKAWKQANFSAYIGNSLLYTVICTGISIILTLFLAFPIARNIIKGAKFLYTLFLIGLFVPDATIPQFQMILNAGLYNTRLGYLMILTSLVTGGVTLFVFVSYLKSIPTDFDDAAAMDGCSYFNYLFTIIMPLMSPAIASMTILNAINVWNDIIKAIIFLSSKALYPMTKGLFIFTGSFRNTVTLQMAALVIVAAPLIILYIFLQRYIIEGTLAGAIRE